MYCNVPRLVPRALIASFAVGIWESGLPGCCILSPFCQPKVQQLRTGFRQHDVARLQIAVRYSLAVGFVERVGNIDGVLQDLIDRQRTFFQALGQRLAFQRLHH
jgi:hypothetical protein